jgi:hypothetical protein
VYSQSVVCASAVNIHHHLGNYLTFFLKLNMKPKLVSEVLRYTSPRKMVGKKVTQPNRYSVLNTNRDSSPADSLRSELSQRSRTFSQSVKRKNSGDDIQGSEMSLSYADAASGIQPQDLLPGQFDEQLAKVRSLCDKVGEAVSNPDLDPALVPVFSAINAAIVGMCDLQAKIVEQKPWKPAVSNPSFSVNPMQNGKKPRHETSDSSGICYTNLASLPAIRLSSQQVENQVDPKVSNFKKAVAEAEKSTLIFNLNLGNVPIMNQDTMSTKATVALTTMAAKIEKAKGTIPSDDTVTVLNDVLSVSTGIQFYGRKTKSYSRKNDPQSGEFCTVPVRYNFVDKEARMEAESVLREKCKVSCSVPYHTMLRESIRQVIDTVKKDYPGEFVRVAVDTNSMQLKVARRPMVDEGDTRKKIWSQVGTVPIPEEALDTNIRIVPTGFQVENIPRKINLEAMEVQPQADTVSTPASQRTARSPTPSKARKNLKL